MASSTTTPQPHQEPAESKDGAGVHIPSRQNKNYRRQTTMKLPARFNVEDTEEDAALPSLDQHANLPMQSLYGLIAQASGRAFFAESLTQTAEGSEDEGEDVAPKPPPQKSPQSRSRTDLLKPDRETEDSSGRDDDPMTQSQFLPPRPAISDRSDRMASTAVLDANSPFITRKLQARSDLDVSSASSSTRTSQDLSRPRTGDDRADLPTTLKNMFLFDEPEDLISEFKCYYIQNVLLHGHLFITEKHVCFYAYLPKKGSKPIKTGHLAKQGKRDPRYSRHWFILKGDVLSYYASAADPHFPIGAVDLRYAISAQVVAEKGKDKRESTTFTITTERRIYYIKADSATSANEWVKQLQRVIFRSHNDGNAVKISVPIANIVEVGQTPVMDFTDTIRLRAGDSDENGSMEEYFFTFLEKGEEATEILQGFVAENKITAGIRGAVGEMADDPRRQIRSRSPLRKSRSPKAGHPRRLSPQANPSVSEGDNARRASQSPSANASSESYVTSSDLTASSLENSQNEDMSASQFLTSNVVFRPSAGRQPTIPRGRPSQDRAELDGKSQNSSRSTSPASRVRMQPPTRTESQQTLQGEQNVSQDGSSQSKPIRILPAPFQHALDLAGRVRDQSKRMGSYLSSSPKDYYSRFSGALVGNKRHYSEADGLMAEERTINDEDEAGNVEEHRRRFLDHFALPESEHLEATFYCWLHRVLPLYGKVYIGSHHLCFRSLIYGTKTKLKLPYTDIENVKKGYSYRWGFPGMTIVIRGHEELFFDFRGRGDRDDCVVTSLKILEGDGRMTESVLMDEGQRAELDSAATEYALLQRARQDSEFTRSTTLPEVGHDEPDEPPILFDDSSASLLDFKPAKSLRVVCLTIGSRGDVQPYIALCKGLLAEGHRPCIATHQEFEGFVTRHGIEFAPVEGNPADLMRICVEYGMFTPSFLIEANNKFRGFLEGLLNTAYTACKDADVLIESPSAMAGIHIAEAMGIPYFRAFTMPWTRTRAYPHAFAPNNHQFGGSLNYFTYVIFDHMFWTATASQINRWRGKVLGLPPTSLEKMQPNKVPFLYNFSPSVVVPPLDFSDWVRVTGYWFLDEGDNWTPPADLLAFIKKARDDEQKLVYIGFGSIVVQDARALTRQIVAAVKQGDVRCILSKGWSDRLNAKDSGHPEIELPDTIFQINAAPHDWLFKQVDAVVHHGGAGTTGASLRAGIPTLVKPFFGDQFFYASRVEDLGVGVYLKKLTAIELGKTLYIATRDERMKAKAKDVGERIRAEHGVDTAIKAIYRDLEYAKTLIKKRRTGKTATRAETRSSSEAGMDEDEEEEEESWTFVEPDSGEETRSRQSSQTRQQQQQQRSNLGLKLLRQGRYGLGY